MDALRCPTVCLTFAGQSLNGGVIIGLDNSYPTVMLESLRAQFIAATRWDTWTGGVSWLQFEEQAGQFQASQAGLTTMFLMVGGTTDYALGRSGANTVASQELIADNARTAGFDYVITTTTTPSTSITGGNETKRVAGNLILTTGALYPTGSFDAVVDLAGHASLDDATDAAWYIDGTHPTIPGAALIADLMEAAVLSLL